MTADDRQLVAEAAAGSRAAGSELFERHWHAAWRLAYSLTRETATADDIAQDAFERAFRGLASFNGRSSFSHVALPDRRQPRGRRRAGREAPLRLEYGGGKLDRVPRRLEIREGTSREAAPRFGPDNPAVPPGRLQLFGFGDNDGSPVDWWIAYLEQDGVYLTLESSEREVVLAAARALAPIEEGS